SSCNCYLICRSGNTLLFARVTHEPPRTIVLWGLTLATIPAGQGKLLEIHRTQKRRFSFSRSLRVFPPLVYVLRLYHIYLMLDQIKQFLFTFVRVVWSEGQLTPAGTTVFDGTSNRSRSTCLKTPQYFKEGRLKPFIANNVDIPFARARRLKPCPRKATGHSGKTNTYFTVHINFED